MLNVQLGGLVAHNMASTRKVVDLTIAESLI